MTDEKYMGLALNLAERGAGFVSPNPLVGAVIVKNGEIIGRGWHARYGEPHAERNALAACTRSPEGATLYVTLEPCCHHGKTPPCTDAILENKLARVVIGSRDPNPAVNGKGIEILKEHGVSVVTGVLEPACDALNEVFFRFVKTGLPFVAMKYAMTLDGKLATRTGKSKWITGEAAREHAHRLRLRYASVMVGVGTVVADDPLLTCRLPGGRNPARVICDTRLSVPTDSEIVKTAGEIPTYIACACDDAEKTARLEERGCRVLRVPSEAGRVDLRRLAAALGREKLDSILIEGGSAVHFSALAAGVVQKVYAYVAPKMFGGERAKTPVGGLGIDAPDDAFSLSGGKITPLGDDILLEYALRPQEAG